MKLRTFYGAWDTYGGIHGEFLFGLCDSVPTFLNRIFHWTIKFVFLVAMKFLKFTANNVNMLRLIEIVWTIEKWATDRWQRLENSEFTYEVSHKCNNFYATRGSISHRQNAQALIQVNCAVFFKRWCGVLLVMGACGSGFFANFVVTSHHNNGAPWNLERACWQKKKR